MTCVLTDAHVTVMSTVIEEIENKRHPATIVPCVTVWDFMMILHRAMFATVREK